ncbi:hypothetical protein BV210_15180 [Halorientalis sp. IM1011]|uniref:DUF389 domain-containing protein n=1 Tax=Halorientalis sp. IM1011 TaxID=1932360 RepID=UPI00097CCD3E|nr:DUF389 domain-containing protein [Halorientalis sp. IM1011]AQL43959.1 hypothetical protein BV210_15180 [Halorientalis sp. IM1011]
MRLLHLSVPTEDRDAVVDTIEEGEFGYFETVGGGDRDDHTLVSVVVPADAVEHVLEDLDAAGYDDSTFTVSVETQFANFPGIDGIQDAWADTPNKLAPRTLRSKAKDMRYNTRAYLWMMILAAVVAVAGLLLASPAVVVGSMVIAPIVSPMLTASVGAVRSDRAMLYESLKMQVAGLIVATLAAAAFSLAVKEFFAVPQALAITSLELVALRTSPGLLSITVGLAAGAAGAFGLATKGQVSIVGVMIAAALIPTAGVAGIGLAWAEFQLGLGALVLLFATIVAVNVGAFSMLWYLGYQDEPGPGRPISTDSLGRTLQVGGTFFLIFVIVAFVAVGFVQQSAFERTANGAATDVLNRAEYQGLEVTESSYEYTGIGPFTTPTSVTYSIRRTSDRAHANLPRALDRRIAAATGANVTVQVRFVDYQVSGTGSDAGPRPGRATTARG